VIGDIYNYLRSANIHPYDIKDHRGYSALHISALNNNSNLVRFLIRYIKDIYSNSADKILQKWANESSEDD